MVWVSNYASVSIVASVTGGDSGDFTLYPKQNETWAQNHWGRDGAETITITWAGGKTTSFQIEKDDHVLVWDDAYGVEKTVKSALFEGPAARDTETEARERDRAAAHAENNQDLNAEWPCMFFAEAGSSAVPLPDDEQAMDSQLEKAPEAFC
ncbi:hypothetical protein B0H11DRAFT_1908676 [Mycena galericulata]|nr:hypothetical protein B0H11DRAFT_1908676 [Mycena galericulata]